MTNKKTVYAIDNVDALIDFLWNEVPIGVLTEAIQKMVDEGLIKVHEPNVLKTNRAKRI